MVLSPAVYILTIVYPEASGEVKRQECIYFLCHNCLCDIISLGISNKTNIYIVLMDYFFGFDTETWQGHLKIYIFSMKWQLGNIQMECRIMRYSIWIFTTCQSTNLKVRNYLYASQKLK